jgi:hypothetical protein
VKNKLIPGREQSSQRPWGRSEQEVLRKGRISSTGIYSERVVAGEAGEV